jgi:hypothetical protein
MKTCTVCPHQTDCLIVGSCLDDLNAPIIASAQFPRNMTPAQANEFMAALRAGRTLSRLTGGGRFGQPIVTLTKARKHCRLYRAWGTEALKLAAANAKAADALKGERKRNLTHCKYGHQLSGDNLYLAPGRKERKCLVCLKRRGELERRMSEEQARRVMDALNDGETISTVTSSGPSYIVNHRALLLFRQKHPKFDRLVLRLSSANAKIHHAEASARRAQILRAPAIAADGTDIFMLIRSAVPANLPAQIRDDVIGAMALEIVEGKLRAADIRRRVREYVTAQYRAFSKFGPLSLDARLYDDGATTLGDTITRGLWD